jgi:hypothetical protein
VLRIVAPWKSPTYGTFYLLPPRPPLLQCAASSWAGGSWFRTWYFKWGGFIWRAFEISPAGLFGIFEIFEIFGIFGIFGVFEIFEIFGVSGA